MKDKRLLINILSVLCILSVIAMIVTLLLGEETAAFTPPPFDPAAQAGIPAVPDGLGYQTLEVGPFRVAICGEVVADGAEAQVYLTNPVGNETWLKVRILNEKGEILGESGLVRPGEYVRNISMGQMPAAGTPIVMKIMAYEPETYHSRGAVTLNTRMGE